MSGTVEYHRSAEEPGMEITWLDNDGQVISLSTASFVLRIGQRGDDAIVTKTSGIVGADDAPNVTVMWAPGELDIAPGVYLWQLTATDAGRDRVCEGTIRILDTIG